MRRFFPVILASGAALVALATIGIYFYERPTSLRVAVPRGSEYQKLLSALNQEFIHGHADIRFKIVPTTGEHAAAKAIEDRNVDLAVVRSDISMPTNAQTALILAHYSAVILAPPHATFTNFSELSGKRIAVIETETSDDANRNLLATIEFAIFPRAQFHQARRNQRERTAAIVAGRRDRRRFYFRSV